MYIYIFICKNIFNISSGFAFISVDVALICVPVCMNCDQCCIDCTYISLILVDVCIDFNDLYTNCELCVFRFQSHCVFILIDVAYMLCTPRFLLILH